jgi:hypothetical protein
LYPCSLFENIDVLVTFYNGDQKMINTKFLPDLNSREEIERVNSGDLILFTKNRQIKCIRNLPGKVNFSILKKKKKRASIPPQESPSKIQCIFSLIALGIFSHYFLKIFNYTRE